MDGIKVPPPLQDTALQIAAKRWTKARGFRRDQWFQAIGSFRETVSKLTGSNSFEYRIIAEMIALAIAAEQNSLLDHVLKLGIEIKDDSVWAKMCSAAAWVILLEYLNDAEKGGRQ